MLFYRKTLKESYENQKNENRKKEKTCPIKIDFFGSRPSRCLRPMYFESNNCYKT